MAEVSLIDGTIRAGVWHGIIHAADPPAIEIRHPGGTLEPQLSERINGQADRWRVDVALPADLLEEGVRSFLVIDVAGGRTLQTLTLSAGVPLHEDLIAEVASLRAELEVLKAAFRRHARESRESLQVTQRPG